jgi:hypothetical protein
MDNKKHYNYLNVIITIIVVAIIGLVLYIVFNTEEIGATNALTDPKTNSDPITNFILKFAHLHLFH